ncbi:non-structural maintenance of chromosomes element 4 [Nematocida major]|uniref:non-structural maintenance of chromosomes element 4 n=1 Tax=Nematocida major TaxID=1912982 RepID=UPI0020075691|nr:non-structural maintenance of chromosomes element 4 [Nematocida major]KAH9386997.1 non-structural maintenance of chromosomes element 4 [Nematocida major]
MENNLAEEYIKLIQMAREKKKTNEHLYPIYQKSNTLLKEIQTPRELRLDAYLANEIVGEEGKRIFLQCNNNITVGAYIEMVSGNMLGHAKISNSFFRGAAIPSHLPLVGTLNKVSRKPKKAKVEKEQEKPENAKESSEEINAPKEIKRVYEILQEMGEIEVFRLVIDANSFGKTVENIFTLSFAVKVGRAFIRERNGTLYASSEKPDAAPESHCIISIQEQDVKQMIEKMNITGSLM